MVPNFSFGVIAEQYWRGVKVVEDCAGCSDMACVHAIAPWEPLRDISAYRLAAGVPSDGISVGQSAKAIKSLWPEIGKLIEIIDGGSSFTPIADAINASRPVSLSVKAGSLPWHGTYLKDHRIAAYLGNGVRGVDPLKAPYSSPIATTLAVLQKAAADHTGTGFYAVIFPTVEEAFKTHPLYVAPVQSKILTAGTYEVKG